MNTAHVALHGDARQLEVGAFETPAPCWAYAVSFPVEVGLQGAEHDLVLSADVEVIEGRIGIGCSNAAGDAFVSEKFLAGDAPSILIRASAPVREVVFRNANPAGPSRFRIRSISVRAEAAVKPVYPVNVEPRHVALEPVPDNGGSIVFNDSAAADINVARMDFIRSLNLPLDGRRVLDVGCGVGHFGRLYSSQGAQVVGVDGREENVREMVGRYPEIEGYVADLQTMPMEAFGSFDIVHAFGLLYHLDSPVAVLRQIERVCNDVLLLETMVCDAEQPVMLLADESMAVNQALVGVGCRPSPSFVVMALNRVGFPYVYGATTAPAHPDFQFEWKGNMDVARNGHNLRCVFVASRTPLANPALTPLLES